MLPSNPPNERKRVKVYELKLNDWFDRGTGFCNASTIHDQARILVESEDDPGRELLQFNIGREHQFQKQQETLIVWTDPEGTDMALSFQEADGCSMIWELVNEVQQRMGDGNESGAIPGPLTLPTATLGNLEAIEEYIRRGTTSQQARDTILKAIMHEDYIASITPLVGEAEDLESLEDLHRLCNIMKMLILFNDNFIIEYIVRDDQVAGVVGALEYDPDFPHHKANHRQYLADNSKYKEVVPMPNPEITQKIHSTYRLQYLKDVVLARILDDPTFGVLNSLIFFNQVDIVQHIQGNQEFLKTLVDTISSSTSDPQKRKDGVLFIQQCCAISKSIQAPTRAALYANLIACGLFSVITFALQHPDASVRVAGTDVLVALIDHDALMIRTHINKAIDEKTKPLTDTLIDLLLVETDLGVKAQIADAMKVLLDPSASSQLAPPERSGENTFFAKFRNSAAGNSETDKFLENFYQASANRLFQPVCELGSYDSEIDQLGVQEVSLFSHLIDILSFLVRQHAHRSKYFILSEGLACRVARLLTCPEKHLKLSAIKYFRTCLSLNDEFHNRQFVQNQLFGPIISLLETSMPRDNLLNSACLDLFEFIRRENVKSIIFHLVETYRERLASINYVDTFPGLILRYEQFKNPPRPADGNDTSFMTSEADSPHTRHVTINGGGMRWQGLRDTDADEDAYFNTSDDEDDEASRGNAPTLLNGASPPTGGRKVTPLVGYADDDDDEEDENERDESSTGSKAAAASAKAEDEKQASAGVQSGETSEVTSPGGASTNSGASSTPPPRPPSSLSEKRRREDDEEDELGKLSMSKRRNSIATATSKKSETPAKEAESVETGWEIVEKQEKDKKEQVSESEENSKPGSRNGLRSRTRAMGAKNTSNGGKIAIALGNNKKDKEKDKARDVSGS